MVVLQILSCILWLVVVPLCMGLLILPFLHKRLQTPAVAFLCGYLFVFTALELIGIPVVLKATYHGFSIFCRLFAPALIFMALTGIVVTFLQRKKGYLLDFRIWTSWKNRTAEEKVLFAVLVVIIGFQMYMAWTRASFDGDDAYYNVQALIAQQLDSLYRINPDTGRSAPLDVRHGLALFPIWEAFVGKMSGIHVAVICHSVIPLLLIPLTYMMYYQIGKLLFQNRKELLPMFMILLAIWQMFGNISIYTTETFFLTRTWQGKAFTGNFIIPMVFWIFLALALPKEEEGKHINGLWIMLACLNLAGGASSSLAVLLSTMLTAGLAVLFTIREKRLGILVKAGFSCVSGGAYVLLYLLLSRGILK